MSNTETLSSGPAALCANLAFGIHSAAQPLAVLEASLSKEHTGSMTVSELRQVVADAAIEVQRVCRLFHCLQQLVIVQSEPQLAPTPLLPLLTEAIDSVDLLFKNDGISIKTELTDASCLVRIHPPRTLHAMSRVLMVAHALSKPGETVQQQAVRSGANVQITVRNEKACPQTVSAETRLSVAIAAAS